MRVLDLSHVIEAGMPVYPGTEPPFVVPATTLAKDGFIEKKIMFYSHTGTHVDAPAHLITGGKTLDAFGLEHFLGTAIMIDVSPAAQAALAQPPVIALSELLPYEQRLQDTDFVLLKTGWSQYWGTGRYYESFPALSAPAAEWLAGFRLKGVGVDTISIDEMDATEFTNHLIFLRRDIVIIENLTNLDDLSDRKAFFSCLPLKIADADGSPVRAVAWLI